MIFDVLMYIWQNFPELQKQLWLSASKMQTWHSMNLLRKYSLPSFRQSMLLQLSIYIIFIVVLNKKRSTPPLPHRKKGGDEKETTLTLSVNAFGTKVLIRVLNIRLLLETGPARQSLAVCRPKKEHSFLTYFKTLSIGPALRIEPATSRSDVKSSTN